VAPQPIAGPNGYYARLHAMGLDAPAKAISPETLLEAGTAWPRSCNFLGQAHKPAPPCANIAPLFILYVGCSMKLSMPRFDQAPVLVVGDVMLDRYWHGGTSRISPEAPVPVVKVEQIETARRCCQRCLEHCRAGRAGLAGRRDRRRRSRRQPGQQPAGAGVRACSSASRTSRPSSSCGS
jgi:hypothetical protein